MNDEDTPPSAAFLAQFRFNPAQDAFVRCAERFSFYVGGVGAGRLAMGHCVRWPARDHPAATIRRCTVRATSHAYSGSTSPSGRVWQWRV